MQTEFGERIFGDCLAIEVDGLGVLALPFQELGQAFYGVQVPRPDFNAWR